MRPVRHVAGFDSDWRAHAPISKIMQLELKYKLRNNCMIALNDPCIRESVDFLCRDGADMPIVRVH